MPIATPMLAALSAGASFTPSPVMEHVSPTRCNDFTILILFSGDVRAKMLHRVTAASSCWSLIRSSSGPVRLTMSSFSTAAGMIPSCMAIATAVAGWSPVIILTCPPALTSAIMIVPCAPNRANVCVWMNVPRSMYQKQ